MTLTLTPSARARFTAWLQDVGSAELRADAIESEMLQVMEDRAESGESMSYELGRQYTTTGQPEIFYADAKDFDMRDRITITKSGLTLALKPSDLRIEISNRSCGYEFAYDLLTVEANDLVFFAAMGLSDEDVHDNYAEWAEWDGCSFATPADRKLFEQTVQSFVERHASDVETTS